MLIYTTIPPRRTGNVLACCDGVKYEFSDNGSGVLVCDVANDDHANSFASRAGLFGVLVQTEGAGAGAENPPPDESPVNYDVPDDPVDNSGADEATAPAVAEEPAKPRRGRPPKQATADAK